MRPLKPVYIRGALIVLLGLLVMACGGGNSNMAGPIPTASPTPSATTDFVAFVNGLFAQTTNTNQPTQINSLTFTNLDAGANAFNNLLP